MKIRRHNPADNNCPINADPRNVTCGCPLIDTEDPLSIEKLQTMLDALNARPITDLTDNEHELARGLSRVIRERTRP